ncbi:MAG: hypothetical protein AAFO58_02110 [Pseudomonadota bacterium]
MADAKDMINHAKTPDKTPDKTPPKDSVSEAKPHPVYGAFWNVNGNFNNTAYGKHIGGWGATLHNDPLLVSTMQSLVHHLEVTVKNFNGLMSAGKGDEIATFVAESKKVIKEAEKSSDPMVRALAMRAQMLIDILEVGLERGYLTQDEIDKANAQAKDMAEKLGFEPSPIVLQEAPGQR